MVSPPNPLIPHLHQALTSLSSSPFPSIASPDAVKKRASVALVIRITPSYSHWPPSSSDAPSDLPSFFSQPWVQQGNPEVLFIKRAARKGDRWTSHIALPGGKRDSEDADDLAAAIRETREEVGLDVSPDNEWVLQAGNLPQRLITTSWGKKPLMVLCPYIFVITGQSGRLRMQPTEVASCHWVPLAALLDGRNRTVVKEDVGNRFANQETGVKKWILGMTIGKMEFSAVRLWPGESVKCAESPAVEAEDGTSWVRRFRNVLPGAVKHESEPPLLLWGLTLGVMADFLDLLPPHNSLSLWSYPTFTPWDVRFAIWAMSWRFKGRKTAEVQQIQQSRVPTIEVGLDAVVPPSDDKLREGGIHGLSTGLDSSTERTQLKSSAVSTMLEGYYDIVRRAVAVALLGRTSVLVAVLAWILIRHRRRKLLSG
ncbi:NUDIX domain-containing protein 3 [Elsinoe australis]|uniref:NUDIX domain-containing protein 3 n=1 Tax=Elsinoe australis TaxID=40998 RepID=A0A4U7B477_9PEZI|nr:NUDIX domain-containing protein 3 [Elsinoe australis]